MRKSAIRMRVLVTGGTGYIGSHCAAALLDAGNEVLISDTLRNRGAEALEDMCRDAWNWQQSRVRA